MNIDPSDASRGLYEKFKVERTDGRSEPGEKHHNCRYFVLDLNHDPFALPAIEAYIAACCVAYPALGNDLHELVIEMEERFG